MRLLTLSILFSALVATTSLQAQPVDISEGRERPRDVWRIYPSADEARLASTENSRYVRNLTEWSWNGDTGEVAFTVPFEWANRQVILRLEDLSSEYVVRVNDRRVGQCSDPQMAAEFNITKQVKEGRNRLQVELARPSKVAVMVSGSEQPAPLIGRSWIVCPPTLYIRDVVTSTRCLENGNMAEIGIVVKSGALNPRTSHIVYELLDPEGGRLTGGIQEKTLRMRGEDTVRFVAKLPDSLLWSPEKPTRCILKLSTRHEGRYVEYIEMPIGFREVQVNDGRMQINGREVALRAAEVASTSSAEELAELRRKGANLVIPIGASLRPDFYTDCDTLGMLVMAVAPIDTHASGQTRRKGGNIANNPRWRAHFVERAEDSYHMSKGHPSVVAFLMARRSENGICLYESYLKMKRYGDPRPFVYFDGGGEWNSDRLIFERLVE